MIWKRTTWYLNCLQHQLSGQKGLIQYPQYLQETYQRNMARPKTTGAWLSVIELQALIMWQKIPGVVAFRVYVVAFRVYGSQPTNLRSNNPATPPTNISLPTVHCSIWWYRLYWQTGDETVPADFHGVVHLLHCGSDSKGVPNHFEVYLHFVFSYFLSSTFILITRMILASTHTQAHTISQ